MVVTSREGTWWIQWVGMSLDFHNTLICTFLIVIFRWIDNMLFKMVN